jgi:hypothetical protein
LKHLETYHPPKIDENWWIPGMVWGKIFPQAGWGFFQCPALKKWVSWCPKNDPCSDLEHLDMAQDLCPVPQSLDDFIQKFVVWSMQHFVSLGQFWAPQLWRFPVFFRRWIAYPAGVLYQLPQLARSSPAPPAWRRARLPRSTSRIWTKVSGSHQRP